MDDVKVPKRKKTLFAKTAKEGIKFLSISKTYLTKLTNLQNTDNYKNVPEYMLVKIVKNRDQL